MNKESRQLQNLAVNLQEQLALLVETTSKLLEEVRQSFTPKRDAGKRPGDFYVAQIKLRLRQYEELSEKMEVVMRQVDALEKEQEERDSLLSTSIMLQQMRAQILMEEKQLQNVREELDLYRQACDTDIAVQHVTLLEKLKKELTQWKK